MASRGGLHEIVELFLANGGDVNLCNNNADSLKSAMVYGSIYDERELELYGNQVNFKRTI